MNNEDENNVISEFLNEWHKLVILLIEPINNIELASQDKIFIEVKELLSHINFLLNVSSFEVNSVPIFILTKINDLIKETHSNWYNFSRFNDKNYIYEAKKSSNELWVFLSPYLIFHENIDRSLKLISLNLDKSKEILEKTEETSKAIAIKNSEAEDILNSLIVIENRIKEFHDHLFLEKDESKSTEEKIKSFIDRFYLESKSINELHEKLLAGPESTSQLISELYRDSRRLNNYLRAVESSFNEQRDQLKNFSEHIFGVDSEDENLKKIGLKESIDDRVKLLTSFENEQSKRHAALFKKIESLLPGATSAGLASAYNTLRKSFDSKINNYTFAFYSALIVLFISGLCMVLDFKLAPFSIGIAKANNWDEMLRMLLTRLPIFIPIIWLAIFSATRRSQYERLQQEYAHKEALALSYEGYKKQLNDLKIDVDDLQKELISKSIEAISYNASITLDGKHTEKPPIFHLFEKMKMDELSKFLEVFSVNKKN